MWFKHISLVSLVGASLLVSGCGFHPLYAPTEDMAMNDDLQHIQIDVIANRAGQKLRNFLMDTITPKGVQKPVKYRLKIALTESFIRLGFRKDSTARHTELIIQAQLDLVDVATAKTILSEKRQVVSSYSLGPKAESGSYSGKIAEEDARRRALNILANDTKLFLAGFLSSHRLAQSKKKEPTDENSL